jgi:Family of unknown function (DUF5572)
MEINEIYKQFDQFDFENDGNYQAGLVTINAKDSIETRHFFFSKTVCSFDLHAYLVQKSAVKQPKELSFGDIMEMVKAGKEIPGVRVIPDIQLGLEKASTSTLDLPKKPWETAAK